jgi:hypothetical protein
MSGCRARGLLLAGALASSWALVITACAGRGAAPAGAAGLPMVVLGDSYSDEWLPAGFPDPFEGFAEILRAARRVDLGPTRFYVWPDPRAEFVIGWQSRNNLAHKGMRAGDVLRAQASRAVALMRAHDIPFASVLTGGGDLLQQLPLFADADGAEQAAEIDRIAATLEAITSELEAALPARSLPIVTTYPDWAHAPFVRFVLTAPGKDVDAALATVALHIEALNDRLRQLAARRGYPLVDLWALVEGIKREGRTVHGIALETSPYFVPARLERVQREILEAAREKRDAAGGRVVELPDARRFAPGELSELRGIFTVDGIHLSPILHALWSNELLERLRSQPRAGLALPEPLTPKLLVTLTGLDPQDDPIAEAGGPYRVARGGDLALDGSRSTDPDPGDRPGLRHAWDLDGDGEFDDAEGERPTLAWTQLEALGLAGGGSRVRVRVRDGYGGADDSPATSLEVVAP